MNTVASSRAIFGPVYAAAYDALYRAKEYAGECDIIAALIAGFGTVRPVRRVLDLGCGTGSHAVCLAARGFDVTGVDASPAMIAQACRKAADGRVAGVAFHDGDIRRLRLDVAPFDAAIMMFAVLGYQHGDDELAAVMAAARAHLARGSVLVFDVWFGPAVLAQRPVRRRREVAGPGGRIVRCAESRLDEARHLCIVDYTLEHRVGSRVAAAVAERHVMRFFFAPELHGLAAAHGFACCMIGRFPCWRLPADAASWSAICVFRAV